MPTGLPLSMTEQAASAGDSQVETAPTPALADSHRPATEAINEEELRAQLQPVFNKFDQDGSGAVSTDEMGKMIAALRMDISKEQLAALMKEADPDGSGGETKLRPACHHQIFCTGVDTHGREHDLHLCVLCANARAMR